VTTVTIVDDHRVVAEGFARLLDSEEQFSTLAVLGSGEALLDSLRSGTIPDVCVLDLSMPGLSGADALRTLHLLYPTIRVLVVSAAARPEIAARCLREGAQGFLSKFSTGESLLKAVGAVADGRRFIDHDLFSEVVEFLATNPTGGRTYEDLSAREFSVMQRLAQGMSIKEIAYEMNLNSKTVSTYRSRILTKLNLTSNAEITAYCLRRGLVTIKDT